MLIVTRKAGETVVIDAPGGERITVQVRQIRGSQVHLGFDAPREIPVHRGEVADRIEEEQVHG